MELQFDKKGNIVRLKDMCDHVIGSGVLYYEEYLGGRLYALTAAHNLYEDGDLFGVLRKSIYVEVYSYTHQCYEPITIRNLSDSVACSPKKNADFAIIVLNKVDVDSINPNLSTIQIVNNCAETKSMLLLGFPKANNHKEVLSSNVTRIEERIGEQQFLLNMEQGIANFYVEGYSGGGIFVENEANENVLLGLFVRVQANEERGHFGYGQYLKDINTILEDKRLPTIRFSYFGVSGLTHNKLSNLCSKSKKNLGPDFGIDVKTTIQPYLDAVCRNDSFFRVFRESLEKWFRDIHFYGNESTSPTGLLEKEFIGIKDHISHIISCLELQLPHEIDFSECSSLINNFMSKVESLRNSIYGQLRELHGESYRQDKESLNTYLSRLYTLERYCDGFDYAIRSTNYLFTNTPIAIIEGEAGCGKSYILGHLSDSLIKSHTPVVFLLGRDFDQKESIECNLKKLIGINCNLDVFLNNCNCIGIERNQRFMILIDAINETEGRHYWKNNIGGFVDVIKKYPAVGLILSIRSTYIKDEIPEGFDKDNGIHFIHHNGLRGNEEEAIHKFCKYYKIAAPTLPLLNPEYSNPLMLHISCEVAQKEGHGRFIMAHTGASSLFDAYRKVYDSKFDDKNDIYDGKHIVSKSIKAIAKEFVDIGADRISFDHCDRLLSEKVGVKYPTLLKDLITSCILSKDYVPGKEEEYVRFTYQRLSDFFIAEALISDCFNSDEVIEKFADVEFKKHLYKNTNISGIIEQLAILLPEKYNLEFWEVIDLSEVDYLYKSSTEILLESLAWRSKEHIDDDKIVKFLKAEDFSYFDYLNTLVLLAPIPGHPFNSDRWHNIMKQMDLPHREQVLQRFLLDYSDVDNNYSCPHIDRLIEWAWRLGVSAEVDDEVARLTGQLMAWFLCSTKNALRDRTTKAMVNLLQGHVLSLISILKSFEGIDDPYILERLYAVAYGCILRTPNVSEKRLIGEYVYHYVFVGSNLPKHLLTRDYMCNIVEYAVENAQLTGVNMKNVLPPYNEQIPEFPSKDEIDAYKIPYDSDIKYRHAQNDILNSVIDGLADFGTKIVDSRVGEFFGWSFKIEEEYVALKKKSRGKKRDLLDCFEIISIRFNAVKEKQENNPLWKPRWSSLERQIMETCFEMLPSLSNQLNKAFGERIANKIQEEYIPNHSKLKTNRYLYGINQSGVRRWIVKRVFDLGYNKDLHGEYDEYVKRIEGYGRQSSDTGRIERIGKKYEWIALWEILGCIADNHCIENPWDTSIPMKYDGAWQNYWRDIDPACITRRQEDIQESSWHDYITYPYWNQEVNAWMETTIDATDIKNYLQREDPDGNKWLTLHDYKTEYEPKEIGADRWGTESRFYIISIYSYIISKRDINRLVKGAEGQNFYDLKRLEPYDGSLYHITREKYWSRGTTLEKKNHNDGKAPLYGGCNVKGIVPIEPMNGNIEGDYSGTRATYYMPRKNLLDMLNARYADEDGLFVNNRGETIVCCNPNRTNHILFRKDRLLEALHSKGLDLVWIVVLEKFYNPHDGSYNSKMTMPSGLFYMDENDNIKGTMTLHKRQ